MTYDAIVLAGGRARRLGGVNKVALGIGGRSLIDIALDATVGARTTIAVGPAMPTARHVEWTREEPVGGGPVAAIAAALPLIRSSVVVVLAADLPFVTVTAVDALLAARRDAVAAMAIDQSGVDQPLLACYDVAALTASLPERPSGASMRALLGELTQVGPIVRTHLGGVPPVTMDCDTADDLSRAQELA